MQALAKALAVLSVTAGLMSGAKALAAPVKVGVSYDLRKPNTTGSTKISQAAVDPIILGVARKVVYLRRLPITTPSCGADVGALEDFHARLANRWDCRTCRYRLKRGPGRSSKYV